ncbi:MAG: hypothetical protein LOY03_11680 [Cyclobacteriaceae bacterium]|jgi:uncharacterized protein HemX|nr:hypothetical protein [Cyclobacteriaceae bacterium]
MRSLAFLIVIFLACGVTAFAQQKKDRKAKRSNKQTEVNQPTSMDPSYPTMNYVPKSERRSSKLEVTYNAERRYYEQMERVAKARKRAEKELAKPQYSDPMYFGHKRPPKKRPPGKMKYCKECGIRH